MKKKQVGVRRFRTSYFGIINNSWHLTGKVITLTAIHRTFKVELSMTYFLYHHKIPVSTTQKEWQNWFKSASLYNVVKCFSFMIGLVLTVTVDTDKLHFAFRCQCVDLKASGVHNVTSVCKRTGQASYGGFLAYIFNWLTANRSHKWQWLL